MVSETKFIMTSLLFIFLITLPYNDCSAAPTGSNDTDMDVRFQVRITEVNTARALSVVLGRTRPLPLLRKHDAIEPGARL